MKKWSFIFFSVLAMIVAGCSDVAPIDPIRPDGVVDQGVDSDVPVEFGYGGMTKAPVTTETLTIDKNFGLFSVEKGVQDLRKADALNFRNKVIKYDPGYGFRFGSYASELVFYPRRSKKEYHFYAYYAHRNDSLIKPQIWDKGIVETGRERKVRFYSYTTKDMISATLGTHNGDILWSKAVSEDGMYDSFNAAIAMAGHKPHFTFRHATACLTFKVKIKEPTSRPMDDYSFSIDWLRIINSPCQADMWLINLDDSTKEGSFDPGSYIFGQEGVAVDNNLVPYPGLRSATGGYNVAEMINPREYDFTKPLGAGYMFIVPQEEPLLCRIKISRWRNGASNGAFYYEFYLDPSEYNSQLTNAHEAGMRYNYTINVDWTSAGTFTGAVGPVVVGSKAIDPKSLSWK